jgi:hypothetical protein
MRPALDPAGHRVPQTKPTCLLHTWRPHRRRPFALVLHLHQHQSSHNLHLQYLAKNQSTQRCQSLITQGSDQPSVLEPHMVLNINGRPPPTSPPTASMAPPLPLCRPIKGWAQSPLHPAPLHEAPLFPASERCHAGAHYRSPDLIVDLLPCPYFRGSKAPGETPTLFSFFWCLFRLFSSPGMLSRPSPASCRRSAAGAGRLPTGLAHGQSGPSDWHGRFRSKGGVPL